MYHRLAGMPPRMPHVAAAAGRWSDRLVVVLVPCSSHYINAYKTKTSHALSIRLRCATNWLAVKLRHCTKIRDQSRLIHRLVPHTPALSHKHSVSPMNNSHPVAAGHPP